MQSYYAYFDPDEELPPTQPNFTNQIEQPVQQIDSSLADQIIQMLNETKKTDKPKLKQITTTDFQDRLYFSNPYLLQGTFWIALGFVVQHLIICSVTFDFWGKGDWYLITLSSG
jgi:hypothetical protein